MVLFFGESFKGDIMGWDTGERGVVYSEWNGGVGRE